MTIRLLLAAAICAGAGAHPAAARDVTVLAHGPLIAALRDAYFAPFSKTAGLTVQAEAWDGSVPALHATADLGDLALAQAPALLAGCSEGVFAKLDWQALGGRDHYQPQAVSDCGVGAFVRAVVLAWDREKFQGTPTWPDFWDVAKFPGKRGLQRGARMNLEIALMADGVSRSDIYRLLRSDDGVDRAFRKLEQIKPYIVWWKSPAHALRLIGSGEVLLSTAPGELVAAAGQATARHFGSRPADGLYEVQSWVIPRVSAAPQDAVKLLAFMGDPARQAGFSAATGLAVLGKGVSDGASDPGSGSPGNSAWLANALEVDDQFWHDNADRLDERFDAWLAH